MRGLLNGTTPLDVWLALEQTPVLIDGGGADTGGPNALPHGKSIWKLGTPTSAGLLIFDPIRRLPGQPWDNSYNYTTLTRTPAQLVSLCWELQFALAPSDLSGNAREFEIELCESGVAYNMAWQYKWSHVDGPPAWRLFDQTAATHKWVPITSIPAPTPKANTFIDVQAFFVIDRAAGVTYHDSIVVDGANYPINLAHKKMQKWSPSVNYLHAATQIDSMGDGVPGSTQIRGWNVRGI